MPYFRYAFLLLAISERENEKLLMMTRRNGCPVGK